MRTTLICALVCAAYLLTACGGGGSDGTDGDEDQCIVNGYAVPKEQCQALGEPLLLIKPPNCAASGVCR